MAKSKTLKKLKTELETQEKLYKFCTVLAFKYARSEDRFASSQLCKEYQITKDCFYKCIYLAVTENLVNDTIVFFMRDKAERNGNLKSRLNVGKSTFRSKKKYHKLFEIRIEKIILSYSNQEIKQMVTYYANNEKVTIKECADLYEVSIMVFKMIVQKSIIESIISIEDFYAIRKRSLRYHWTPQNEYYFDYLQLERKAWKGTAA